MAIRKPLFRTLAICVLLFAQAGCGGGTQPRTTEPSVSVPAPTTPDPTKPPEKETPPVVTMPQRDRLHQAFETAIRSAEDPPAESNRPPDATISGKGVFALYQQVQKEWDSIRFTTPAGKKITWTATIETEKGALEMAFYPEHAPNHVRNFLALGKVGYFDGLCFERICQEEAANMAGKLEQVEFGCPVGTGEPGNGSIGYWLKPEFNKLVHEPGSIGSLRGIEEDTGACRCYISLDKATFLDGKHTVFGKVTKGLDVARIIFQQPVNAEDAMRPGSRRADRPVKIIKVSLHQQEG